MASAKNNNNTAGDATGGFKTVAFGFDKNDVTLYIASLRKKMKQMEEEFEDKLSQALENPAASNEALKHEREVIRAEMEKMWADKLNERNSILKQQQERINELERKIGENNETIVSLKTQLSAVTADDSATDSSVLSARAAKAYMQFSNVLSAMQKSIGQTIDRMEATWKGEFVEELAAIENDEAAMRAVQAPVISAAPAVQAAPAAVKPAENVKTEPAANNAAEAAAAAPEASPKKEAEKETKAAEPAQISNAEIKAAPVTDILDEPAFSDESQNAVKENAIPKKKAEEKPAKPAAEVKAPAAEAKAPAAAPMSFDDFLAQDEDDPLKGIIADMGDDTSSSFSEKPAVKDMPAVAVDSVPAPVKEAAPAPAPAPTTTPASAPTTAPAPAPVEAMDSSEFGDLLADDADDTPNNSTNSITNNIDDDLMGLMADSEQAPPAPKPAPQPAAAAAPAPQKPAVPKPVPPKIQIDDDLSSLLADDSDDNDIKPIDNPVIATDDFADLLLGKSDDVDSDFLITGNDPRNAKGDDLDVSLLSDMVMDSRDISTNGDLGVMMEEQEKKELEQFGNMFVTEADENNAPTFPREPENKKSKKDDDNPFDFSFLDEDSDDEDDMSTDASFPGLL